MNISFRAAYEKHVYIVIQCDETYGSQLHRKVKGNNSLHSLATKQTRPARTSARHGLQGCEDKTYGSVYNYYIIIVKNLENRLHG